MNMSGFGSVFFKVIFKGTLNFLKKKKVMKDKTHNDLNCTKRKCFAHGR